MFYAVDFKKLAPPLADSEKRIQAIRLLPEIERSFILYPASSSQHSSSNMSDYSLYANASKVPILLDLDELDSYPTPIQVKKETPVTTSSKPAAAPKPNPRTRASTSKKRKGSETSAPASEGFSYEDLSFTDSLEPMTSFLHKVISWPNILHVYVECVSWLANIKPYMYFVLHGLQHLLNLYTEACETTKIQEVKIKKLETTVVDQGTIAEAKTWHYEDKLKKVTQYAEVRLAAPHVEPEQAMISFREGIKNSAVVSLLQAQIKMAYEAKETGLECPAWPVDSWVAKLKELGGNTVPYPSKCRARESSKTAEVVVEAGEKKDAGADAG
ncbi:hypothetical protein HanPI659440_Chr16g0635011 [Helianthus annuus]|nr:hypothetical protein HanPI659440_Chr16g0635011 [Helianthus annuus]